MSCQNDHTCDWRALELPAENPRYATIAEMLGRVNADRNVLDVGCGTGLLRAWLPAEAAYTGIERSVEAVRLARERDATFRIIHTSAEDFDANGERFDSVVFNEMLYYVPDPIELLRRYAPLLRPGGVILCSIYQKPEHVSVMRRMWRWFAGGRYDSNVHCAKLIRAFMTGAAWRILGDQTVPIPGTSGWWQIWLARPRRSREVKPKAFQQLIKPGVPAINGVAPLCFRRRDRAAGG